MAAKQKARVRRKLGCLRGKMGAAELQLLAADRKEQEVLVSTGVPDFFNHVPVEKAEAGVVPHPPEDPRGHEFMSPQNATAKPECRRGCGGKCNRSAATSQLDPGSQLQI